MASGFARLSTQLSLILQSAAQCPFEYFTLHPSNATASFLLHAESPLIIQNFTYDWPALKTWSSSEVFIDRYGDLRLPIMEPHDEPVFWESQEVSIREYLTNEQHKNKSMLQFDNVPLLQALIRDYKLDLPLTAVHAQHAFVLGRTGTGNSLHAHKANWIAQIAGRKAWMLAHPKSDVRQYEELHPCALLDLRSQQLWPSHMKLCIVHPGDIIYLPSYWHHATCNLDEFTAGVGGRGFESAFRPKSVLHVQTNNFKDLRAELACCSNVTDVIGDNNETLLFYAAAAGTSADILEFLIEQRSDVNAFNSAGYQPMHVAAVNGRKTVIQTLVNAGASLSAEYDKQLLHVRDDYAEVMQFLKPYYLQESEL